MSAPVSQSQRVAVNFKQDRRKKFFYDRVEIPRPPRFCMMARDDPGGRVPDRRKGMAMKMEMLLVPIQAQNRITRRDRYLIELRRMRLDPTRIGWSDGLDRDALQKLETIIAWVRRWRATGGDRRRMARQGFFHPPVAPPTAPEHDWRRFVRWLRGSKGCA